MENLAVLDEKLVEPLGVITCSDGAAPFADGVF